MDLRDEAARWLAEDPDPETRAELSALLAAGDEQALAERFGARLEFGTAGIRGPLGAGPARMNRVVVRRVTAGLAAHLLAAVPDVRIRGVVVGRDARHRSEEFAADTAGVFAAAGIPVRVFERPVPTPLLAFAVRELDAAAGVQITASHNPASDNGYKVYWSGGAQITAPLDAQISTAIDAVHDRRDVADLGSAGIAPVDPHVWPAYVKAALAGIGPVGQARDLRIAYTPLHGVALDLVRGLLEAGGFRDLHVVAEQAEPDPGFPTVPFPNPEEPGALDLVIDLARRVEADVVVANDPDGDRIAVAVPTPDGDWRPLSGDEVGCVLAESLLSARNGGAERVVGTTVVSSTLLASVARAHGVGFVATLTGFKWLAAAAAQAESEGRRMVLAYEQALGVMVGTAVRDKDGLSAALAIADLADRLKREGLTLLDALDDLARRHGLHVTRGRSVRLQGAEGPALVRRVLDGLRARPPRTVAGADVVATEDYATGVRTCADGTTTPLGTPRSDLYALETADSGRIAVRPSGTEPLLKFYFEVVEPVGDGAVADGRARAEVRLDQLERDLFANVDLSSASRETSS